MKQKRLERKCIRHRSMLYQTIRTEEWLQEMAQNGRNVERVQGSMFQFVLTQPSDSRYFVMTPESGKNSDDWIFHEFALQLGQVVPCSGPSLLSPSHLLRVKQHITVEQFSLVTYYYQFRNYRLLKRFKRNAAFAGVFFLFGLLDSIWGFPVHAVALLPYTIVSGLFFFHFFRSYVLFRKDCLMMGFEKPERKPKRPGY